MRVIGKLILPAVAAAACAAAIGLPAARGVQRRDTAQEPPGAHDTRSAGAIPSSIRAEHEELHEELAGVIKMGGKTGAAAREVRELLHEHFLKEEEYALPPLGLLPLLARGESVPHASEMIRLTDKLKADMPQMLREHEAVKAALERLAAAGRSERKPAAVRFAEKLRRHATGEEEVLYPSAILVGEHLKMLAGK